MCVCFFLGGAFERMNQVPYALPSNDSFFCPIVRQ